MTAAIDVPADAAVAAVNPRKIDLVLTSSATTLAAKSFGNTRNERATPPRQPRRFRY